MSETEDGSLTVADISVSLPIYLDKAQESLRAAELLLDRGCHNSAVNRAYYAIFHAARAALVAAKVSGPDDAWSHEAVQSHFPLLSRKQKLYPAHLGADLAWVRSMRDIADYKSTMVSLRMATKAKKRAALFVSLVTKEISK